MNDNQNLSGEFVLNPQPTTSDKPEPETTPIQQDAQPSPVHAEQPIQKPPGQTHTHPEIQKHPYHKKPHFYSSLAYYPDGITFENQEEDEEIILLVRRDFITNLPWILGAIGLAVLPFFLIPLLPIIAPFITISDITRILYLLFYYLAITGYVIVEFSLWYFHVGIVTNKHIIDIDVHGILSRDVARTPLSNIEDVKYSQVGVIRSIFNYGDVHIQTAGTNVNFEFDKAPEPSLIIQIIQDLIGRTRS